MTQSNPSHKNKDIFLHNKDKNTTNHVIICLDSDEQSKLQKNIPKKLPLSQSKKCIKTKQKQKQTPKKKLKKISDQQNIHEIEDDLECIQTNRKSNRIAKKKRVQYQKSNKHNSKPQKISRITASSHARISPYRRINKSRLPKSQKITKSFFQKTPGPELINSQQQKIPNIFQIIRKQGNQQLKQQQQTTSNSNKVDNASNKHQQLKAPVQNNQMLQSQSKLEHRKAKVIIQQIKLISIMESNDGVQTQRFNKQYIQHKPCINTPIQSYQNILLFGDGSKMHQTLDSATSKNNSKKTENQTIQKQERGLAAGNQQGIIEISASQSRQPQDAFSQMPRKKDGQNQKQLQRLEQKPTQDEKQQWLMDFQPASNKNQFYQPEINPQTFTFPQSKKYFSYEALNEAQQLSRIYQQNLIQSQYLNQQQNQEQLTEKMVRSKLKKKITKPAIQYFRNQIKQISTQGQQNNTNNGLQSQYPFYKPQSNCNQFSIMNSKLKCILSIKKYFKNSNMCTVLYEEQFNTKSKNVKSLLNQYFGIDHDKDSKYFAQFEPKASEAEPQVVELEKVRLFYPQKLLEFYELATKILPVEVDNQVVYDLPEKKKQKIRHLEF